MGHSLFHIPVFVFGMQNKKHFYNKTNSKKWKKAFSRGEWRKEKNYIVYYNFIYNIFFRYYLDLATDFYNRFQIKEGEGRLNI